MLSIHAQLFSFPKTPAQLECMFEGDAVRFVHTSTRYRHPVQTFIYLPMLQMKYYPIYKYNPPPAQRASLSRLWRDTKPPDLSPVVDYSI